MCTYRSILYMYSPGCTFSSILNESCRTIVKMINKITKGAEAEPCGHDTSVGWAQMVPTIHGDDCGHHHKQCTLIFGTWHRYPVWRGRGVHLQLRIKKL